ncbi:MAG: aldolase/citrate lyase family protein [Pseudomonadales bacterium]
MEIPANRFKLALSKGSTQFGLWLGIPDNSVAEIAAGAGFDWLLIDHEHGAFELHNVLSHLQAIAPYSVAPIVRPVNDDPALLKKLLDIGVQSFLIPMVDTADQASELVQSVRYPPAGKRGLGTSMARAARWNQVPGYMHSANEEICLIIQVETVSAMVNLNAILTVEGVDGVFIGPSDLSASMGHIGNADHPEVVEAVTNGLRAIRAANKHAGVLCLDPALFDAYVDAGANFVGVGVDTLILSTGAASLAKRFKAPGSNEEQPSQADY